MKFFTYLALIGSATAVHLSQHHVPQAPTSLLKVSQRAVARASTMTKLHSKKVSFNLLKTKLKSKWENLTEEQEKEIEDWATEELTTGEKTITKDEAFAAMKAFGEEHGFPPLPEEALAELEKMFDETDTNGDGAIDLEELSAACELKVKNSKVPKSLLKIGHKAKAVLKMDDLTAEQQLEIMEWIISELGGGTITKQEAHDALVGFLDKHGYPQPTPEEWEFLEAIFDHIDKNGDGELDLKEFVMSMMGQEGGSEAVQLKPVHATMMKIKAALPQKLTPEQEREIMEWVISELGGGTITKKEAHDAIVGFCDKHGFPQPTPDEWEILEAIFDHIDKNGDGELDLKEFATAMSGH